MSRMDRGPSLDERLKNWGRGSRGGQDKLDAMRIEQAWRQLESRQREVLRMVYVWNVSRHLICRRLQIKCEPQMLLEIEVINASNAIKKILGQ
jgi:DNA-directed RNA polymerase specialized sigma24 family protein